MSATTIDLSINNSSRIVTANSVETYFGTITNHTDTELAASDLFFNFTGFNPTLVSLTQNLGVPDFIIPSGGTSPTVNLFEFDLGPAGPGHYKADVVLQDAIGNSSNEVTVTETIVPEPGAFGLCLIGLLLVLLARSRRRTILVFAVAAMAALLVAQSPLFAQASPVTLGTGTPAISIWPDGSVSVAIPIMNTSDAPAENLTVTRALIRGGSTLPIVSYPAVLGTIVPNGQRAAQAVFQVPVIDGRTYLVTINGTYVSTGTTYGFSLNRGINPIRVNNNPIPSIGGTSGKKNAGNVVFPLPPPPQTEREFNAPDATAPVGPPRNFFGTPLGSTNLGSASLFVGLAGLSPALTASIMPKIIAQDNPVTFIRNTNFAGPYSLPPDPTVAGTNGNDVAMAASNTTVFYSTDGGQSFNQVSLTNLVDPQIPSRNAFYPQDDGGLCCDQVLTYVPQQGIFVWLLQYWPSAAGPNRLRIAWATPQGIKNDFLHAWTWVDLTSGPVANVDDGVGLGSDWMDYPDLTFSDNFVYVSADHGIKGTGQVFTNNRVFIRLSLGDIVNPNIPVVNYQYMQPNRSNLVKSHYAQQSRDAGLWACAKDTSTMSVFVWPDNSGNASVNDVAMTQYSNTDYSATAPDGVSWNAAPGGVLGGTLTAPGRLCPPEGCPPGGNRFMYFAFTAGRNGPGRPFPYVRVEKIDRDTMARVSELDIWNPGFAFATPALNSPAGGGLDEVAISLATGGGGNYANNAVGFLGDFIVFTTGSSDATQTFLQFDMNGNVIKDSSGNPIYGVRFGDYYSVRNAIGPPTANGRGVGYSTLGYEVKTNTSGQTCAVAGCSIGLHYVLFGRTGELFPPPPPR